MHFVTRVFCKKNYTIKIYIVQKVLLSYILYLHFLEHLGLQVDQYHLLFQCLLEILWFLEHQWLPLLLEIQECLLAQEGLVDQQVLDCLVDQGCLLALDLQMLQKLQMYPDFLVLHHHPLHLDYLVALEYLEDQLYLCLQSFL